MIAVLQPLILHYREEFWRSINNTFPLDIYTHYNNSTIKKGSFSQGELEAKHVKNIDILDKILIYDIFPFLNKSYDTLVLPLHFGQLTTWILLLTKFLHKKTIILTGQGISVKRYIKESKRPNLFIKLMIKMTDIVWLYTDHEKNIWSRIFPEKNIIALNNTIANVDSILGIHNDKYNILNLKQKYNIEQEIILLFCARFSTLNRRPDLLEYVIKNLDSNKYGFVIIGDGEIKPDFGCYSNVYDFGAIYDKNLKDDLFSVADIYIQPAWLGLSVVEAMAYGKPVFTLFREGRSIMQGVEFAYVENGYNGLIFDSIDSLIEGVNIISKKEVEEMGRNARKYVAKNLMMSNMIENAMKSIQNTTKK